MTLSDFQKLKQYGYSTKQIIQYGKSEHKSVEKFIDTVDIDSKETFEQPFNSKEGCTTTKKTS